MIFVYIHLYLLLYSLYSVHSLYNIFTLVKKLNSYYRKAGESTKYFAVPDVNQNRKCLIYQAKLRKQFKMRILKHFTCYSLCFGI